METGRRFELRRQVDVTGVSGVGVVAEGIQFRDGRVALRWLTETASSALYDSMDHVQAIHGHEGATEIHWIDRDLPGGRAAGMPDSAFDPAELARGTRVELEHTSDVEVAKQIAKDHLAERADYYTALEEIDPHDNPCACSLQQPQQENLADLSQIDLSVGGPARVGEAEVCDDSSCEVLHTLVRGDHVSFVTVERAQEAERRHPGKRADLHRLPHLMPSDVPIPRGFVIAHDATGRLLSKCDVYVLRWRGGGVKATTNIHEKDVAAARDYFGSDARVSFGKLEIPAGKWTRVARVRVVRYRRHGFKTAFAHRYDPPVDLFMCSRPLAWRIALPEGCVIDSRGFVRP